MRWLPRLYRVQGGSMEPTYRHGDLLLGWGGRPRIGDVVVVRLDKPVIKRLVRIEPGGLWLEGDNATASTDSRTYGLVDQRKLEAKIIARLARSG